MYVHIHIYFNYYKGVENLCSMNSIWGKRNPYTERLSFQI